MKRYPFVVGTTVAGLAALFSFHTAGTKKATKVAVGPTANSTAGATTTTTAPSISATAQPTTGATTTTAATKTRSAVGQDVEYQYGDVQLKVSETATRIVAVSVVSNGAADPRSEQINGQAVPILVSEVLKAHSSDIDAVSGATYTSQAFSQALKSALSEIGS